MSAMKACAALYVRPSAALVVSPADQEAGLRQLAADRGWHVVGVHCDAGVVGGKAGQRRPGQARLLDGVRLRAYEVVLVQSLHLLGRDLPDLVSLLTAVRAAGVTLITIAEQIDTAATDTLPHGLLDVAADLLDTHRRFTQRERILDGQQRARAAGVRIGRPPVPQSRLKRVQAALDAGAGVRAAGRLAGVSPTSVLRLRDEMRGRVEQDAPSAD